MAPYNLGVWGPTRPVLACVLCGTPFSASLGPAWWPLPRQNLDCLGPRRALFDGTWGWRRAVLSACHPTMLGMVGAWQVVRVAVWDSYDFLRFLR
jgi:hypothetical protein